MELRIFKACEVAGDVTPDADGNIKTYYEERCGKYVCISKVFVDKLGFNKAQKLIDEAFAKALSK